MHTLIDNLTPVPSWIHQREESLTPSMSFAAAAKLWIESKVATPSRKSYATGYIRRTTETGYRNDLGSLNLFFAETKLRDIRLDHLARYQRLRVQGAAPFIRKRRPQDKEATPCPAKPKQVNQELGMLVRILKKAKLWGDDQQGVYEPLIEDMEEIPRALTPQQQRHWLDTSRSHPRWNVVHWYSLLAFDTCMSTNEIRALRLGDINLQQRVLTVPVEGAKNRYRHRSIPIVSEGAMWALESLMRRAIDLGAGDPTHYLFPSRATVGHWNPTLPMTVSGIKKQWEEVRAAANLTWFRQYDCRHTAITRLAEGGTPLATIMRRAGHVSAKMTDHYTHISDQMQIQSVRAAQQYNGRYQPDFPMVGIPTTSSASLIEQLRALQQQLGVSTEDMREALNQPGTVGFATKGGLRG
jgi:integrase